MKKKYICIVCGYIYDENIGIPGENIPPNTTWNDIPNDWLCPECGVSKEQFELLASKQ